LGMNPIESFNSDFCSVLGEGHVAQCVTLLMGDLIVRPHQCTRNDASIRR